MSRMPNISDLPEKSQFSSWWYAKALLETPPHQVVPAASAGRSVCVFLGIWKTHDRSAKMYRKKPVQRTWYSSSKHPEPWCYHGGSMEQKPAEMVVQPSQFFWLTVLSTIKYCTFLSSMFAFLKSSPCLNIHFSGRDEVVMIHSTVSK